MKSSIRMVLILSLALLSCSPLFAGCVDQECTDPWNSAWPIVNSMPMGQSFVPSESEHVGLDLRLSSSNPGNHLPVTVLLHENVIDGPIVAGSSVTFIPRSGVYTEWVPCAFNLPIPLTPGSTYVIEVISETHNLAWTAVSSGCYGAGHGYRDGNYYAGDFNFHTWVSCDEFLQATLQCDPPVGSLPLNVHMNANLKNLYGGQVRRYSARIDVELAGGYVFSNWRSGFMNLHAGRQFTEEWNQYLPLLGPLKGPNVFTLVAEDVTPAPYNQPPYLPSGVTDTDSCTVTGSVP